jgi:hypothetical protein
MSNTAKRPIVIGVICGEFPPKEMEPMGEKVGELIARQGGVLICGGMGGLMEKACEGAWKAGGLTIGVLPTSRKNDANPYVVLPIVTAMNTMRNVIIVRTADALIAIDGNFGTLTEIIHGLDLKKKVVLLNSWPIAKLGIDSDQFIEVSTPEEAVKKAYEVAKEAIDRANDPPSPSSSNAPKPHWKM